MESGSVSPAPAPSPRPAGQGAPQAGRLQAATVCPPSGLRVGALSSCLSPQDAWSDQKGQIHPDSQQDYQLLQAERTPDGLSLLFKRPFSTCDPQDYRIEVGGGCVPTTSGAAPLSNLGGIPGPVMQRESQGGTPEAAGGTGLLAASDPPGGALGFTTFRQNSGRSPGELLPQPGPVAN